MQLNHEVFHDLGVFCGSSLDNVVRFVDDEFFQQGVKFVAQSSQLRHELDFVVAGDTCPRISDTCPRISKGSVSDENL